MVRKNYVRSMQAEMRDRLQSNYICTYVRLGPSLDKGLSLRRRNATINATAPIESENLSGDRRWGDEASAKAQAGPGARVSDRQPNQHAILSPRNRRNINMMKCGPRSYWPEVTSLLGFHRDQVLPSPARRSVADAVACTPSKRGMCEWPPWHNYRILPSEFHYPIHKQLIQSLLLSLYLRLRIAFNSIYVEYNEIGLLKTQTSKYRKQKCALYVVDENSEGIRESVWPIPSPLVRKHHSANRVRYDTVPFH